jgi:hypothetical protein
MGYYRKALSRESAQKILSTAQPIGLSLYFMTDDNVLFSLGRSPIDEPSPSSYGGDKPSTASSPIVVRNRWSFLGKGTTIRSSPSPIFSPEQNTEIQNPVQNRTEQNNLLRTKTDWRQCGEETH